MRKMFVRVLCAAAALSLCAGGMAEQSVGSERVLEIEDEAEYVERVAREKLGYANPNETVYKDIQGEE